MRVTIEFEQKDYDGELTKSTFSKDLGEGYYEDLLYAYGCAARGAGFAWDYLTSASEYRDEKGKIQRKETTAAF